MTLGTGSTFSSPNIGIENRVGHANRLQLRHELLSVVNKFICIPNCSLIMHCHAYFQSLFTATSLTLNWGHYDSSTNHVPPTCSASASGLFIAGLRDGPISSSAHVQQRPTSSHNVVTGYTLAQAGASPLCRGVFVVHMQVGNSKWLCKQTQPW